MRDHLRDSCPSFIRVRKPLADVLRNVRSQLRGRSHDPRVPRHIHVAIFSTDHSTPERAEKVIGPHQSAFVEVVAQYPGDSDMSVPSTTFLALENADVLEAWHHSTQTFDEHIEVTCHASTIKHVLPISQGQHDSQTTRFTQTADLSSSTTRRSFSIHGQLV